MMRRVLEAMLYDPTSPLQGYRASGAAPAGWHEIKAYYHLKYSDYHFSADTLRAAPLAGSRFTEKGGWDVTVREGDDKYGWWNFSTLVGDYYVNVSEV